VARRGPELQADPPQVQPLAVGDLAVREADVSARSVDHGGAGRRGQLQVTRQEVGVHVGFDHVLDPESGRGGGLEVLPDISPGIDHRRPPGGLVPDQVRGLR
jgi:hypothetical protein